MLSINPDQTFSYPAAENAHFVKLDASESPTLSAFSQGVYAVLTIPATEIGVSSSTTLSSSSVLENTAYQDVPFNTQLSSVSTGSADQITANAKKGWITISVDTDSADVVYVGDIGVTTGNGYMLKSSNPSITVSSDDLSEWYVTGALGGERLYVVGAYLT